MGRRPVRIVAVASSRSENEDARARGPCYEYLRATMPARLAIFLSGILGASGVAAGAMGAHALEDRLPAELLKIYHTAATYQMYHALALLGVGLLFGRGRSVAASVAGWSFLLGVLLFSGSLYAYVFSGGELKFLVMLTPFGGTLLILGWVAIAAHACRRAPWETHP